MGLAVSCSLESTPNGNVRRPYFTLWWDWKRSFRILLFCAQALAPKQRSARRKNVQRNSVSKIPFLSAQEVKMSLLRFTQLHLSDVSLHLRNHSDWSLSNVWLAGHLSSERILVGRKTSCHLLWGS